MTHIPGHVGTEADGDAGGDFLSQFTGQTVFTQDGQAFEVRAVQAGSITTYRLFPAGGGRQLSGREMRGLTFVDNLGIGHTIGQVSGGDYPLSSRSLSESALARFFGVGDSGAGRAPPSFASTQAAQTQAETFARQQAATLAAAREEELEEDSRQREIDRELRLREARLTTARDLINIKSAEAREARKQGVQLAGEDPFKFTAIARGLAGPTGTTPSAGFKQNLAQAGSFEAPDLAGLDSAALESVIAKLSQLNLSPQQPFGFAHGGTLSPSGAQSGTGAQAVPVG
ncbi:hypothetical protein LCGC14_1255510, partial [marine sediment metagenome]